MPYVTEETITDIAVERWKTANDPRLGEIMGSLVKHLHDFVREVRPTEAEWLAACNFLAATGQMSDEKRQEFILLSDVLGVSMLVVQMNNKLDDKATPNTVLGPFHIDDSPELPNAADMAEGIEGETCYVTGTVRDLQGNPIADAVLDVWQADGDGLYEVQIPGLEEARLRGLYRTEADGSYTLKTISPLGYTIPMDGTVGKLISQTRISHFRPAHIHFLVDVPGYKKLITHLFREGAPYLENDVVFGVKEPLITKFEDRPAGPTPDGGTSSKPFTVVNFDIVLERATD
jgi:hydroxyquinol 1,2-dioxygenase